MIRQFRTVPMPAVALFAVVAAGLALGLSQATSILSTPAAHHAITLPQPGTQAPPGPGSSQSGQSGQQANQQRSESLPPAQPAAAQAAPSTAQSAPVHDRCSQTVAQYGRTLPMCAPIPPQP